MTDKNLCSHSYAPAYTRDDLCARVAPLNSYGLTGVSSALAGGLSALASLSKHALCALRIRACD